MIWGHPQVANQVRMQENYSHASIHAYYPSFPTKKKELIIEFFRQLCSGDKCVNEKWLQECIRR